MHNFLSLILKYGHHVTFVILEVLCFYLIITFNQTQKLIWYNSTSLLSSAVNNRIDKVNGYLQLESLNDSLINENAKLLQRFIQLDEKHLEKDSFHIEKYQLIPATVCNNSINLRNNYLTLCKGQNEGIESDMGVITSSGIVGIVMSSSDHYSLVLSILNSQSKISCRLKNKEAFGTLVWNGYTSKFLNLEGVPKHISISVGDTIVTSGFSTIFPPNIPVGVVDKYKIITGSNELDIQVNIFEDPLSLSHVYVVNNLEAEEQLKLELKKSYEN
ncbi:MAG TPA: rod shape-determining protein MreC [Saprospiraceae bacterium]|nr:rod shape-determining protein MreC [Saprospiraceae bacterium]HPK08698.1 rod shape-determining protein MreC [Saprospiraceae bacterium]HPQ20452.1 rod shape-determining protein MreC [Saprospiraceae bacterium]